MEELIEDYMKFSPKSYYKPTPVCIRKISDSILAGVMFLSASSLLHNHPKTGLIVLFIGAFAKIVSNFFSAD